jgi:RNA polymerase sigma factor (sigma-70 family)
MNQNAMITNPFTDDAGTDGDRGLVEHAKNGSHEALEQLVTRHQSWIFNIVVRMVWHPQDAEDITQEILIKLITKLSTFEGRSAFRTWLYRLVVNHVLNMKRARAEEAEWTFEKYSSGLNGAPDEDFPDASAVPADAQLVLEEAKIGCTSGMLLCLTREQRVVYILGEIFGVSDVIGAELLDITRENFRQKLSRARRDLHQFMMGQCGLVNEANPCRCSRKTRAFMKAGYLDPGNLLFAAAHVTRVRDVAPKVRRQLDTMDEAYAELHRAHPFQAGPDFVAAVRRLIGGATLALVCLLAAACASPADDFSTDAIVALERGALDRWQKGDPGGFYEIMAADQNYFDPLTERRLDGSTAVKGHLDPFAGKFSSERLDIVNPHVRRQDDLAVLTFNLNSYGGQTNGGPKEDAEWNSTEVYQRIDGKWKIVHSHWSYVKPDVKPKVKRPASSGRTISTYRTPVQTFVRACRP